VSDWWFYMWLRREGYRIHLPSWFFSLLKWCFVSLLIAGFIYAFIIFHALQKQPLKERRTPSHVHTQRSH
jgi:hypothetical protein